MHHRKQSSIAGLRFFHNWIKRTIITDAASYLKKNYNIHNIKLLDLAVGKGGDMQKWYDSGIYNVVGIDIDDNSINGKGGAKDRYRQFKQQINKPVDYSFFVFDLSNPDNVAKIDNIIGDRKFNIISCQFAIHYFFRDPVALDTFMNIVSRYMDNNALFVGTTMNGLKLTDMFSKYGNTIERDLYSFKNLSNANVDANAYGNKYIVSLGKTNANKNDKHYFSEKPSEEYIFDINELTKVANKYGLIFAGSESFDIWYNNYHKKNEMSASEKEFSFLNISFAYKKTI